MIEVLGWIFLAGIVGALLVTIVDVVDAVFETNRNVKKLLKGKK